MTNQKRLMLLLIISGFISNLSSNDWTWSYRKKFNEEETKKLSDKPNIIYSKVQVPQYNQLIFSWNAIRPKKGYFSFYVQPRYAITKTWGEWYKMADWGARVQKSYCILKDGDTSFMYVRLELPHGKLADGFRLKIEPQKGANLSNLRLISVCVSDFSKFSPENIDQFDQLPPVDIEGIVKKSQMLLNHSHNNKMCSPTSTCMLVSFLTKKYINPLSFALKVYDNGLQAYGSWPFNIAHAFERCLSYYFRVIRLGSFIDLHKYLSNGTPVVVSVRGKMDGAPLEYNKGHLILIKGWDSKTKEVICHDPAFDDNSLVEHRYDISSFLRAWERSHRLAYVAEKQ